MEWLNILLPYPVHTNTEVWLTNDRLLPQSPFILNYSRYRWFPILLMNSMYPLPSKRGKWRRNNWTVNGMLSSLFNFVSPSFSPFMPLCVMIYSPFSWWAIIFVMLPLLPCIFLTVSTNILLGLCRYCIRLLLSLLSLLLHHYYRNQHPSTIVYLFIRLFQF